MPDPRYDIETMTLGYAQKEGLVGAISTVTQQTMAFVLARVAETSSRAQVKRAFKDVWPDDADLGKLKAPEGIRGCLVPRLARMLGRPAEEVEQQLRAAPSNMRLRKLFGAEWPAG